MKNTGTLTFATLMAQDKIIEIPIIQRDYVQGRGSAEEVRTQFIETIAKTLSISPENLEEPLDLDFVYGSLHGSDKETFWPLDGQQRLTTLFLLHWYLANRDGEIESFHEMVLKNQQVRFTYQTRSSSRMFFNELAKVSISIDDLPDISANEHALSDAIKNSKWFFVSLGYDPTVQSALTMLDAIHYRFHKSSGFYQRLVGVEKPYVTFQFLNLEEFGLSDDLYIKMNARGKPLTAFENFKAKFEQTVGELCKDETMTLHGVTMPVKDYISRKMDTDWADLFWVFCGADTHKIDDQQMYFFRSIFEVLFVISTDKADEAKVRTFLEKIRDDKFEPTHFRYVELGFFSKSLILNLITLMNRLSLSSGSFKQYLQDGAYYDEKAVFSLALEKLLARRRDTSGLTYQPAVQFFAWCLFLIRKEGDIDHDSFYQWTRITRNLTINSRIENVNLYLDALSSLMILNEKSDNVLSFLASADHKLTLQGFYNPQVREECIKAQLILRSDNWKKLIFRAEQHGYLQGQIEFLLDFSGVYSFFLGHGDCNWGEDADVKFLAAFEEYLQKTESLFESNGIYKIDDYLFERALLVKGDYLLKSIGNHSFLKNGFERDLSWKRLLRGSESGNDVSKVTEKRAYLKEVMDDLDLQDIEASLKKIIESSGSIDEWRRMLVDQPQMFGYCKDRFIRRLENDEVIYLMKRKQTNGAHLELRTYHLYLSLLKSKTELELYPFKSAKLEETYSADDYPSVYLDGMIYEGKTIYLEITYANECYRTVLMTDDGEVPLSLINHVADYINGEVHPTERLEVQFKEKDFDLGLTKFLGHLATFVADLVLEKA